MIRFGGEEYDNFGGHLGFATVLMSRQATLALGSPEPAPHKLMALECESPIGWADDQRFRYLVVPFYLEKDLSSLSKWEGFEAKDIRGYNDSGLLQE